MALSWDGSVDRKLNVMLTRARQHLILLGDPQALMSACLPDGSASHYALLLQELRERGDWMEEPDTGFEGDVRESTRWAAMVGISDWFDWQAFEDVPASYLGDPEVK